MPGSRTSKSTKSGRSRRATSKPCSADDADSTSCFSRFPSSVSPQHIEGSSSITKMVAIKKHY
jgi:hypothetical protein